MFRAVDVGFLYVDDNPGLGETAPAVPDGFRRLVIGILLPDAVQPYGVRDCLAVRVTLSMPTAKTSMADRKL